MMKLTFSLLSLLSLILPSQADTPILSADFTKTITTTDQFAQEGWTRNAYRTNANNTPLYGLTFDKNKGLTNSDNWPQLNISHDCSLSSQNAYKIEFTVTTTATNFNQQTLLVLGGDNYSLILGNSYETNTTTQMGYYNSNIFNSEINFGFQNNDETNVATTYTPTTGTETTIPVGTTSYFIMLASGLLTLTTTWAEGTNTTTYKINDEFDFNKIGFALDGVSGTTNIANLTVTQSSTSIPEPTTTSLSLLSLLVLMAHRRRKA